MIYRGLSQWVVCGVVSACLVWAAGCDDGMISFDAGAIDSGGRDAGPPPGDCFDGMQNGDETDRDCGGSCAGCDLTRGCLVGEDCRSGACVDGRCDLPTCFDSVENGDESDIDCGGMECDPCPEESRCRTSADCSSESCRGGVCAEPSCTDGAFNGNETDTDCGGPTCDPCATGEMCMRRDDCIDQVCVDHACAEATCMDNIHNGDETDRDCGGSTCRGCRDRQMCSIDADCGSLDCTAGACVGNGDFEDDFETGMISSSWTNASSTWTASTTTPLAGTYSARTQLASFSSSRLDLTVDCAVAGMAQFSYGVTTDFGDFEFWVDSTQRMSWASTTSGSAMFPVAAGRHTLSFRFNSGFGSIETASIDDVVTVGCNTP
ncbi:MAG: hypothetical protein AB7S26_10200 [Sandaracinaceae bacterium]